MPNCYTALEEVVYTFGGPWLFGFILLGILILLALVLSVARMKYVGADEVPAVMPTRHGSQIDHSFPFLESLNEVHLSFIFVLFVLLYMQSCLNPPTILLNIVVKMNLVFVQVLETHRNEESQNHVHRMYFMGPNTFSEPWHLPHSPPQQVKEIV